MPSPKHPRRGSMQFWPRKRSRHSLVRVRSWANETKAKPLGFICYKAGMTHLQVVDNRPKALTKGENIFCAATIIECPPMKVAGVSFYKSSSYGIKKSASILALNLDKELSKKISVAKKSKNFDDVKEFDDLRLIVYSKPAKTNIGTKKPKLIEIGLGGSKDEKLQYAKEILGKDILVNDAFEIGNSVDVHGVTKGKGFQGTVKRFGVPIRQHKAEKTKRGIGNLGAWTPKRVQFNVPQGGKMGYHLRTEYNKQIIKIGEDGKEVTPKGGITKFGVVKNPYILLKGSVVGPRKRAVLLIQSIRSNKKITKSAPEVSYISLSN
jgi:large subunit ribosomal protein L3